ncbi:MAG: hypothetical protein ACK4Q5_15855 [Saprospiraceae bacterium]
MTKRFATNALCVGLAALAPMLLQAQKVCVRNATQEPDMAVCPADITTVPNLVQPNNDIFLRFTPPNPHSADPTDLADLGWYKAFWIFGDGTYWKPEDDQQNQDALSHTVTHNYAYTKTKYPVSVYLTERYSNDNPPPNNRVIITPDDNTVTPDPDPNANELDGGRLIRLNYNHNPRPGYPFVMPITFAPSAGATRVYLFYNGFADATNGAASSAHQWIDFGNQVNWPAYFRLKPGVTTVSEVDVSTFATGRPTYLSGLATRFTHCLQFDFNGVDIDSKIFPPDMGGLRVFPELTTAMPPAGATGLPITSLVFAAVVVNGTGIDTSTDPKIIARVANLSKVIFGNDTSLPTNNYEIGDDEFIADIDTLHLRIVASHDPNQLKIKHIYDLGDGKRRVDFALQICNEGSIKEPRPTMFIRDLTEGKFTELRFLEKPTPTSTDLAPTGNPHEWKAILHDFEIPAVPHPYAPACRTVEFSATTTDAGIAALTVRDPRALRACVNFSLGEEGNLICCENDTIAKDKFKDVKGDYPPPPSPCKCFGFGWWFCLMLALGLLGLLVLIWKIFFKN